MHPDARVELRKFDRLQESPAPVLPYKFDLGHVGIGMNGISSTIDKHLVKFAFCLAKSDLPFSCQFFLQKGQEKENKIMRTHSYVMFCLEWR